MKKLFIILLLSLSISCTALAQNIWGPQSGTLGPGTYHVVGNTSVPSGDSLTILPGTILYFDGGYDFDIYGYIYAVGTEEDSIKFLRNPGSDNWNGIDINPSASDDGVFEYCVISESACIGMDFVSSSPTVKHCTFKQCNAGGG